MAAAVAAPSPAGDVAPMEIVVVPPFAWPALPAPTAPLIAAPSGALATLAKDLQYWLAAVLAALAIWLVRLRNARWSRIVVEQAVIPREPPPEPEIPLSPGMIAPLASAQAAVPGADLAERARFVAMSFTFPEPSPARPNTSREGPTGWPLHMSCQPTRFTLTLRHAALAYRLEFCNRGAEPLGPLIIRADLVSAESRAAPDRRHEFALDALPLCHYLDGLPAGDSVELTGELRLPLAGVAAIRLGTAELLVPLLRLCAESAGDAQPALGATASFAIGLPPLSAGGGIQPFRLDSGPAIWRKLTSRRVADSDLR